MFRIYRAIRLLALLLIGFILVNCTLPYGERRKEIPFYPIPSSENFPEEIAHLESIVEKSADSSVRSGAHLKLAWLYSHHKNPSSDYSRSLKELEAYISLDLERGKTDEIQTWLKVLQSLEKAEEKSRKLRKHVELLQKENQVIEENRKQLLKENQKLKETIEKLKNLDLWLEEKRKDMK